MPQGRDITRGPENPEPGPEEVRHNSTPQGSIHLLRTPENTFLVRAPGQNADLHFENRAEADRVYDRILENLLKGADPYR